MKKITLTLVVGSAPWAAQAQSLADMLVDGNMVKIGLGVVCLGLAMLFILEMFRRFFDYQLKNKALETRVPEELAAVILKDKPGSEQRNAVKWSFIFAGLGIGLTICNYTLPWGTHSVATLSLSLAAALFAYNRYLRSSEK